MSMRSHKYMNGTQPWKCYDWNTRPSGKRTSIFIGGLVTTLPSPQKQRATEFVVIEDIAVTPTLPLVSMPNRYCHDTVDLTRCRYGNRRTSCLRPSPYQHHDYFLDPDNVPNDGIPGAASPYPRVLTSSLPSTSTLTFMFYPDKFGTFW